jgi:hypothetical protein
MQNKIVVLFLLILIVVSILLYPLWGVQLFLWSSLFLFVRNYRHVIKPESDKFFIDLIGFSYPLLEIIVKIFIIFSIIPYSWFWLNRVEHFIFSMFMTLLLFPFFARFVAKIKLWPVLLMIASIVLLMGTVNEIFEYVLRVVLHFQSAQSAIFYGDTILDLATNIVGLTFGCLLLYLKDRGYFEQVHTKKSQSR